MSGRNNHKDKLRDRIIIWILYIIAALALATGIYVAIKDMLEGPINYIGATVVIILIILAICEPKSK